MEQIVIVCGEWVFDKKRWYFVVDGKRGSRLILADNCLRYENLIEMVCEDYRINKGEYEVKLSYMLSKEILQKLPQDTPPVYISNCRQLQVFLGQSRGSCRRVCVELKEKYEVPIHKFEEVCDEVDEVCKAQQKLEEYWDEDDESRFDACEDSDGTDSDDEKLEALGMLHEEGKQDEHDKNVKLPPKKRGAPMFVSEANARVVQFRNFDLSNLDLAVGQKYDTKEDLVTRMKILSVVQKFDFDVHKSTPFLWIAKCWVKGCSWKVRATPVDDYPSFHVRQYVSEHTCSVTERSARSRQATHEILALLYKDCVGGVGPTVLPIHVAEALNKRFQTKVSGRV